MLSGSFKTEGESQSPSFGSPLRVVLTTLLIFLLSQIFSIFVVAIGYGITHPHGGGIESFISDSVTGQFFYVLIAESLAAILALLIVKRRKLGLSSIGLGRRPKLNDLLLAVAGFAVFFGILIVAGILTSFIPDIGKEKQDVGFKDLHTNLDQILAFVSLVILPPLGEETLVRGYLYSGLRQFWRFLPAIIISSIFFGLAHLQLGAGTPLVWAAAIDTFLLAVVLGFLRERTGALYAGMLVHMLNNLIAFFVLIK